MLELIALFLFILWVVGLAASYTLGGWIHVLLVGALMLIAIKAMQYRRLVIQLERKWTAENLRPLS